MSFISPKHASDRSSGKRSRVLLDAHAAAIFGSLARLPERGGAYGWKRRAVEWCIGTGFSIKRKTRLRLKVIAASNRRREITLVFIAKMKILSKSAKDTIV